MNVHHTDPEAARFIPRFVRTALTGHGDNAHGCDAVLDEIEALDPEMRRRVLHELLTFASSASAVLYGPGVLDFLDQVERSIG